MKQRWLRDFHRRARPFFSHAGGSILIYVIAVMTVFGLLGAAVVAMFSSATMMSTGTPNHARQARYMAESGMRYAVAELRNAYNPDTVDRLNTTDYTISGAGSFDLNVFGRWFQSTTAYDISSGNVMLSIPEGEVPKGFSLPRDLRLLNLEGFRDAKNFGGDPETFVSKINAVPDMSTDPFTVNLNDSFIVDQNEAVLPAVRADNSYDPAVTLLAGSTLLVDKEAGSVFPKKNGSFYIESTLGEKKRYFYEEMVPGDPVQLKKISDDIYVFRDDWVALTEQNHILVADGASGGAGSGGSQELAMDFRPNIVSPQGVPVPPPLSLPPDVAPTDFISGGTATPENTAAAVTVDTTTGQEKIVLGGNTTQTSGAAFFGGNVKRGGFDVCTSGKCNFFDGIRAFFVFTYTGTGDGFTFAVANGTNNGLDAYGDTGGSLGYAGISPTGKQINKPKMAVEFDTYTNSGQNDPDNSVAGWTNRDMVQSVYWGTDAVSVSDDVRHDEDSGGREQKWVFTNPWGAIYSTPAVDPVDGSIIVGSLDNRVWSIRPDGSEKWRYDTQANVYSAAVIGPDRTVYIGSNVSGGRLLALSDTGALKWKYDVASDLKSPPALDSNGILYFGTSVNDPYFYALDSNSPAAPKWIFPPAPAAVYINVDGAAALSPDEASVYFVAPDPYGSTNSSGDTNHFLFALNTADGSLRWLPFNLRGPVYSSPRVAEDGTIYVGSDGESGIGYLFAINADGTLKWRYDFSPTNPRSTPAIGPDGTIYIGNDDDYLYAISDEGTSASMKWRFLTSGNVRSSPLVHQDGSIWFGSDDNRVYALDTAGNQLAKYDAWNNIRAGLAQGADGTVYAPTASSDETDGNVFAFSPACQPQNIKNRHYSYDDLLAGDSIENAGSIASQDDWLQSGPWAARIEIARSRSPNSRGRYEYALKLWLRQCQQSGCSDILGTYFEDTRIEYAAKAPHLTQTAELCSTDHTSFNTFIFGFTEGTGSAVQRVTISDVQLGFIRPGDSVIQNDSGWQ
ncbi:MAG: PQQ-binding-like beta-propeller repeat protein [Desulfobacterales bacterium]|jgi:hypothetical protein